MPELLNETDDQQDNPADFQESVKKSYEVDVAIRFLHESIEDLTQVQKYMDDIEDRLHHSTLDAYGEILTDLIRGDDCKHCCTEIYVKDWED